MLHTFITITHKMRGAPVIGMLLVGSFLGAAVWVQPVYLDPVTADNQFDFAEPFDPDGGGVGILLDIPGILKFDPALGTLNQIVLSIQEYPGNVRVPYSLRADLEFSAEGPVSFSFIPGGISDAGVFYLPSNANGFLYALNNVALTMDGTDSGDLESFFPGDQLYDLVMLDDEMGLGDYSDLMSQGFYHGPDFIGSGFVDTLKVGAFVPASAQFDDLSSNISAMTVFMEIGLMGGWLDVEYHYTPVPEPRHFSLSVVIGLGAALLLRRKSRRT